MYAQQLTRSFIINMKGKKQNSFQKEKFWRKIETKNKIIALNVLFSASIGDEVNQVCISKHNSEHETKVTV